MNGPEFSSVPLLVTIWCVLHFCVTAAPRWRFSCYCPAHACPQAWGMYQKRISWVKSLVRLAPHRELSDCSSELLYTCSLGDHVVPLPRENIRLQIFASLVGVKENSLVSLIILWLQVGLSPSEAATCSLIRQHTCSFLYSDRFSIGWPMFSYIVL